MGIFWRGAKAPFCLRMLIIVFADWLEKSWTMTILRGRSQDFSQLMHAIRIFVYSLKCLGYIGRRGEDIGQHALVHQRIR